MLGIKRKIPPRTDGNILLALRFHLTASALSEKQSAFDTHILLKKQIGTNLNKYEKPLFETYAHDI